MGILLFVLAFFTGLPFILFSVELSIFWGIGVFLFGDFLDFLTTYIIARRCGLYFFYSHETNVILTQYVKKYGLEMGLLRHLFDIRRLLGLLLYVLIYGLPYYFISGLNLSLSMGATVLFAIGMVSLFAAINNIIVLINPWRERYRRKDKNLK